MPGKNTKDQEINLTTALKELSGIVSWFEDQESRGLDVEAGLQKVREAAELIKASKGRLSQIDNEFRTIERDIQADIGTSSTSPATTRPVAKSTSPDGSIEYPEEEVNPEDIPF